MHRPAYAANWEIMRARLSRDRSARRPPPPGAAREGQEGAEPQSPQSLSDAVPLTDERLPAWGCDLPCGERRRLVEVGLEVGVHVAVGHHENDGSRKRARGGGVQLS